MELWTKLMNIEEAMFKIGLQKLAIIRWKNCSIYFCWIKIWLNFFVNVTNMVNLHISYKLKRRSFLLSNANISTHQAMLWTKRMQLCCQQM